MEDLRVLEEQQRDSQRKLVQVKTLKHNRLERRSAVENMLASLKYRNGEHRAQINRAHEVLSMTTREMEAVKLDATRNDERLKTFDNKLKKALIRSRMHQTYRRKIDGRIINIRSRESVCHRLLSALREDVKTAEKTLQDAKIEEQHLRQATSHLNTKAKSISEETSKVRTEVSGIAEDLHSAKQMQASTKLRAESIAAEIEAEDARHTDEMAAMKKRLEEAHSKKSALAAKRKTMTEELETQYTKIHELWLACVVIQVEEGHHPSPEPTEGGPFPYLDVDSILKTVQEQDQNLAAATATRDELRAKCQFQSDQMRTLEGEHATLVMESAETLKISEMAHHVELQRTGHHEKFLSGLEKERDEVKNLRASLADLENGLHEEKERLEAKLKDHIDLINKKQVELDGLKRSLSEKNEAVVENKALLVLEKAESSFKLETTKKHADAAKAAFEKVQGEVEALRDEDDLELDQEAEEIERAQIIMVEGTKAKIVRLLKGMQHLMNLLSLHINSLTFFPL